jgi:hypothetical protein
VEPVAVASTVAFTVSEPCERIATGRVPTMSTGWLRSTVSKVNTTTLPSSTPMYAGSPGVVHSRVVVSMVDATAGAWVAPREAKLAGSSGAPRARPARRESIAVSREVMVDRTTRR